LPTPLTSAILSGVKLSSQSVAGSPSEILISGANNVSGFFPITNPNTGSAILGGGILLTVNPSSQNAGFTETLILGQALSLYLVFNGSSQCRFAIIPSGSNPIYSPWFSVGTEHTLGISYDLINSNVVLALDGSAQTTSVNFLGATTSPFLTLASYSSGVSVPGTYNGFIDQLAIFNAPISSDLLEKFTSDPVGFSNALSSTVAGSTYIPGHVESINIVYATLAYATSTVGSFNLTLYPDASNSNLSNARGVQVGDSLQGLYIPTNATVTAISSAGIVSFSTPNGLGTLSNFNSLNNKNLITFLHSKVTSFSTTAQYSGTSIPIPISSINQIQIGDSISGVNVPLGETVIGFTNNGSAILSLPISSLIPIPSGVNLAFTHPAVLVNTNAQVSNDSTPGSNTVKVVSTQGIQVGDIVSGSVNLLTNEIVTGINGNILTLNSNNTSSLGQLGSLTAGEILSFRHPNASYSQTSSINSPYPFTTAISNFGSTITVSGVTGILTGDFVNGPSLVPNTKVVAINSTNPASITLSSAPTSAISSPKTFSFTHPNVISTSEDNSVPSSGSILTLNSSTNLGGAGINVGDFVTGSNIPYADTVIAIGNYTVTLRQTPSSVITGGAALSFIHPASPNVALIYINSSSTASNSSFAINDVISLQIPNGTNSSTTTLSYTVSASDVVPLGNTNAGTQSIANIVQSIIKNNPTVGNFNLVPGPTYNCIELVPNIQNLDNSYIFPLPKSQSLDSFGIDENQVTDYFNFSQVTSALNVTGSNGSSAATGLATFYNSLGNPSSAATATLYSGALPSTAPKTVVHGPVYLELLGFENKNGLITQTVSVYADQGFALSGNLSAIGFTLNVPVNQATILSLLPLLNGTISQSNISNLGASATYQWASSAGISNFTLPIATLTMTLTSPQVNTINGTLTNLSMNDVFYKAEGSTLATQVVTDINSQYFNISGTFFSQYNNLKGTPFVSSDAIYSIDANKIPMPYTDLNYVVLGNAACDILMNLNTFTTPLTAVNNKNPNITISIDILAQTATKGKYSFTVNLPSNASNATFKPSTAFSPSLNNTNGHLLNLSGTYTPNATGGLAVIGTLSVTLNNEMNTGSQFSIDSVSTPSNTSAIGQSLYFGAAETNAQGKYKISNIPQGQISFFPFDNPTLADPNLISINDALATLGIASGRGLPSPGGKAPIPLSALIPSDYNAADFNKDGVITASDALGILSFYVSSSKNPNALSYTYLAALNNISATPESVTNVVLPSISPFNTGSFYTTGVLANGGEQVIDFVGVLNGNVVSF